MKRGIILLVFCLLMGAFVIAEFSVLDIAPKGFVYDPPEEISEETAILALDGAEVDIQEMKDFGFITLFPNDALIEAKKSYDSGDYEQTIKVTQLISYIKEEKINFFDRVKLLEVKKQVMVEKGMKSSDDVDAMMSQAMNAFNLDQIDEANEMLEKSNEMLEDEEKEQSRLRVITLLSKNFFARYWWQSLIVLVLLIVTTPLVFKKWHKRRLKKTITRLKLEAKKTKEVIKKLQKECFVDRKITTKSYQERAAKYEERIAEIKQKVPVLESELRGEKVKESKFKEIFGKKK
jgi:hypothetical protein